MDFSWSERAQDPTFVFSDSLNWIKATSELGTC